MQESIGQYYKNTRDEMMPFVPGDAKQVLDIGCGVGAFGERIKEQRIAEVWGIELNEVAVQEARKVLDHVEVGDALDVMDRWQEKQFDAIICNDVIEHVVDTDRLLSTVRAHLRKGGVLVASVPNMRFLGNILHVLFEKDWRYEEEGIRDATHVRFFTQKSLVRTLQHAGFDVVRLEGINGYHPKKFRWLNWLSFGYLSDTQHLQFAVVAKKRG